jgi:hypothetical protein
MAYDSAAGKLLLATGDGLFNASARPRQRIGPAINFTAFTIDGNGDYYASGHPGHGTDLPDPTGLIRSTDRGRTWEALPQETRTRFRSLAAVNSGLVAFDGSLRLTGNLTDWSAPVPAQTPLALSGSPAAPVVLGTSPHGLQRSSDGGRTWTQPSGPPKLTASAFADSATAVGATAAGAIHVSRDTGQSWQHRGTTSAPPACLTAAIGADGNLLIWAATPHGLAHSGDGGKTFTRFTP